MKNKFPPIYEPVLSKRQTPVGCIWFLYIVGVICLIASLLIFCTSCASSGWYERVETQIIKIEANTGASADTIKDPVIQKKRQDKIKDAETNTPKDTTFDDLIKWLIGILGVSIFGVTGGRHIVKMILVKFLGNNINGSSDREIPTSKD